MSLTALAWVAVVAALVLLSFKRAVYGLALYFFTFFLFPQVWWWGRSDLPEWRWSLSAGIVLLVAVVLQRMGESSDVDRPSRQLPLFLAVAFLANATLVHLLSPSLSISLGHYALVAKFVLLFFLVATSLRSESDIKIALWALVLSAAYIGYETTINDRGSITGARLEGVGAAGVQNANQLASLFATILPLGGCLFFLSRTWQKLLIVPAIGFMVNVLLLCNSRGAFLAVICASSVFLVLSPTAARKRAVQGLALGGVAVFLLLGDPDITNRFLSIFVSAEERDSSASSRLVFWRAGANVVLDHPLGSGGDAFVEHYASRYLVEAGSSATERAVHNGYLNEAVEWGIQGLVLKLLLLLTVASRARSRLRTSTDPGSALLGACLMASMTAFLLSSVFGNYLDDEWGYWIAGFMLAYATSSWAFESVSDRTPVPAPVVSRIPARVQ